jgi:hypothetical protein
VSSALGSNGSSTVANSSGAKSSGANSSGIKSSGASVSSLGSKSSASAAATRYIPIAVNELSSSLIPIAQDLILVDPSSPLNPVPIATPLPIDFITLPSADYNPTTGLTSNAQPAYAVYMKDGKLYKVDLRKGAVAPTPVQVSNETQAAAACSSIPTTLRSFPDYDPNNSVIVYKALKLGGCVSKAVTLGMSATDASYFLGANEILKPFLDPTGGHIRGFLIKSGADLATVDTQFMNLAVVGTGNKISIVSGSNKSFVVNIDGAIKRFDFATKTLSEALITFPADQVTRGLSDNSAHYFSGRAQLNDAGTPVGKIGIYKLTDTAVPTLFILSNLADEYHVLGLTTSNIVLGGLIGNIKASLPKTGGFRTLLSTPDVSDLRGAHGERVFYSVPTGFLDAWRSSFGSILTDNTGIVEFPNSYSVTAKRDAINLYQPGEISKYVLFEYTSDTGSAAKGKLNLIDGASGEKTSVLGTAPDIDYDDILGDSLQYGAISFCASSVCDGFSHTDTADSLVKVTNHIP